MIRTKFLPLLCMILVTACAARTQSTAPRRVRLNQEPHVSAASGLCRDPTQVFGPHVSAEEYFSLLPPSHNRLARNSIAVGSVIVKEKYVGGKLSVTTTMTKIDELRDDASWRYAMRNAQGQDITETWRAQTGMECVDCHRKYKANDYASPIFWKYYQAAVSNQEVGIEKDRSAETR